MKQVIEFVQLEKITKAIELRDSFSFRKDKKYRWIQKILFFILKKIEAYSLSEDVRFTRHIVQPQDIISGIIGQNREILKVYNREGERLLVGSEDYYQLTKDPDIRSVLSFDAQYMFDNRICGLKVSIIPWMKGILILPKNLD